MQQCNLDHRCRRRLHFSLVYVLEEQLVGKTALISTRCFFNDVRRNESFRLVHKTTTAFLSVCLCRCAFQSHHIFTLGISNLSLVFALHNFLNYARVCVRVFFFIYCFFGPPSSFTMRLCDYDFIYLFISPLQPRKQEDHISSLGK